MISYDYPNPSNDFYLNDLMEYDPSDNSWEVKSPYPGMPRSGTAVFTIGSYAYAGGGSNGAHLQDFYRYNPSTNTWIEIEELSGPVQVRGAFPINSKGYVVLENNFNPVPMQKYTPKYCPPMSSGRRATE